MIVTSICSSYREGTRYETNIVRRTNRGQGRRKDIELFLYLCDVIDGCTPRGIRMGEALELHAGHPHEHARGQRSPVDDSASSGDGAYRKEGRP